MPAEEVNFEQPVPDKPAETPAEAPPEEPKAEGSDPAVPKQETEERDEKGRFKRPIQPRIDELTRAKHEAEREAAYWRGVAEAAKGSSKPDAVAEKPTPDQFTDHNEYVEKLAEWKAEQIVEAKLQKRDAEAKQSQEKAQRETRATTWADRASKFAETAPDFEEVVGSSETRMPAHVLDALQTLESGPALAYHLAKNPGDAQRIAALPKEAALVELGELKASLGKPALKSVTKAPAPITPVKSGSSNVVDLNKASQAEYEAARKAQGAWWAR